MTASEKGIELLIKFEKVNFSQNVEYNKKCAKACALICVDEILNIHKNKEGMYIPVSEVALNYWKKVRAYIEGSK